MSLSVTVKSASNLPNLQRFSKSDPMAVLVFQGQKHRTKVIDNNLDPVWEETFEWPFQFAPARTDVVWIEVYDYEKIGRNRLLGKGEISIHDIIDKGRFSPVVKLMGKNGESLQSTISLDMNYTTPTTKSVFRGEGDEEYKEYEEEGVVTDNEEGKEGDEGGGEGSLVVPSNVHTSAQEKQRRKEARANLADEATDFQIHFHVIEARKLQGGGLNPVVKVSCGTQVKWTRPRKGTNNPFFDEILYFKFNEYPKDLFDKTVEMSVLNSKVSPLKSLIGSFKFDVGTAYDERDHCFIHKWAILTDQGHSSKNVQGYTKFSIKIIGPGEDPTPFPSTMSQEVVDKEFNLLSSSGVDFQKMWLNIKVYHAEDFPQMDANFFQGVKKFLHVGSVQKDLVDPYCVVSFAGHVGKTRVIWNEQDPQWNQEFNFTIKFPSMCERIQFQLMDKDKLTADDYIGTYFLNLSDISSEAPGEGFLPTFGPSYVNIYGSPREYTDLPDEFEHLNMGEMEGISYRGRVMIKVDMTDEKCPSQKCRDIEREEMDKLTPFLRRRRYKLFATFYSATMVKPANEAVTFEVSIGNYGNKQEDNYPLQPSTTPPTHPSLYGSSLYYIPWMYQKPYVEVESHWEDNTYRIESQNILFFTAEGLGTSLETVKKIMIQEKYNNICRDILIKAIKKAIGHNRHDIPELPQTGYTELDKGKRKARIRDLKLMLNEATELLMKDDLTLSSLIAAAQDYYTRLMKLANEPQNSVPDVIIWMLSGQKRVAYHRIPSNELMYSTEVKKRGRQCGKFQNIVLRPPADEKNEVKGTDPAGALVRCAIWLGLEQDQSKRGRVDKEGEVEVFAETYENQSQLLGRWGSMGLTRPSWSDSEGKIKMPKEAFEPAPGWDWVSDWNISPTSAFDEDERREELQVDIFEYQSKKPSSFWPTDIFDSSWGDIDGEGQSRSEEKSLPRDNVKLPEGWAWSNEWQVDTNRACDEDGWEYSVDLYTLKPFERNNHLRRRRRWIRTRVRSMDSETREAQRLKSFDEGWEYAKLHHMSYHRYEKMLDLARRRRWLRKIVQDKPGHRNVFTFKKDRRDDDKDESQMVQHSPRIYLSFQEPHKYQLRAYIYLVRDLYASDKSGLINPYCVVSFDHYSQEARIISDSLYQTLILDNIFLFGDPATVCESPPPFVIELYDRESAVRSNFLGIVRCAPVVKLTPDTPQPSLQWYEVMRYGQHSGDLLAASELLLEKAMNVLFEVPEQLTKDNLTVPDGIRLTYQKMRIEIHCRGLRDLHSAISPFVKIECAGKIEKTATFEKAPRNPNFPHPLVVLDVDLPTEEKYSPPLKIRILDDHGYGQCSVLGTHIVETLEIETDPWGTKRKQGVEQSQPEDVTVLKGEQEEKRSNVISDSNLVKFDWWSKYYASINDQEQQEYMYLEEGHDLLEVYRSKLEDIFSDFSERFSTFPLYQEKGTCDSNDSERQTVGYFKGAIKVYPLPDDGSPEPPNVLGTGCYFPPSEPVEVVVRVYIIKGIGLQPRDSNGKSDPYLIVDLGEKEFDDENYIENTVNPLFGKMFQIPTTLPLDHKLKVRVMDHDLTCTSADELVGETEIDLEDRFFTLYHASCGLPQSFSRSVPNKWRDYELPKDILKWHCKTQSLPNPDWKSDGEVLFNGKTYNIRDIDMGQSKLRPDLGSPDQRLALYILHEQGLVPEHIETRTLYHPMYPGISQGALHMWVDIFPNNPSLPDPVDITPREQSGLKRKHAPASPQKMESVEEMVINEERKPPHPSDVFKQLRQKSSKWRDIGRELGVALDFRTSLENQGLQKSDPDKLEAILHKWDESVCSEVSWKNLIQVLKSLELNDAVNAVVSYLQSQEAVKKYNYEKDSSDNL